MAISYPRINGLYFDWSSIEINIDGDVVVGVKEITYSDTTEPGEVRGPAPNLIGRTRAEHGDVWLLDVGSDQVAFRCPSRAEYKRFLSRVSDERKALPDAQEELARAVVVAPDRATFGALLDRRPGSPRRSSSTPSRWPAPRRPRAQKNCSPLRGGAALPLDRRGGAPRLRPRWARTRRTCRHAARRRVPGARAALPHVEEVADVRRTGVRRLTSSSRASCLLCGRAQLARGDR
jgi:hypothetical protein